MHGITYPQKEIVCLDLRGRETRAKRGIFVSLVDVDGDFLHRAAELETVASATVPIVGRRVLVDHANHESAGIEVEEVDPRRIIGVHSFVVFQCGLYAGHGLFKF